MKNTIIKKTKKRYLFLALMLTAFAFSSYSVKANALDFHGIPYDSLPAHLTAYHININLNGMAGKEQYGGNDGRDILVDKRAWWQKSTHTLRVIFEFNDVRLKTHEQGTHFAIMANMDLTINSKFDLTKWIIFSSNFYTGLTNNHYKELIEMDKTKFRNVTISVFLGGSSNKINIDFDMASLIEFSTTEVPKEVINSDSDGYESEFGNSGNSSVTDSDGNSLVPVKKGISWLADFFNTTTDTITLVFIIALVIILLSLVLSFIKALYSLFD